MSYNPTLGRFVQRDPIGYADGMNVLQAYRSNPSRYVDPMGTISGPGPATFYESWSSEQRSNWMRDFHQEYGSSIADSARKNGVPQELLAAVVANEVIDWGRSEQAAENLGFGYSVGPAQITPSTTDREGVWTPEELRAIDGIAYRNRGRGAGLTDPQDIKRELLKWPDINIDMAGRLMSKYLKKLCQQSAVGQIGSSFQDHVLGSGFDLASFCNRCGRASDDIVGMDVPYNVIAAMAAIWNNGPGITQVKDIPVNAPNAHIHSQNAQQLDGLLSNRW
jgi:hypothetical protein